MPQNKVEKAYQYEHADGEVAYERVRYLGPNGEKKFSDRRKIEGIEQWVWGLTAGQYYLDPRRNAWFKTGKEYPDGCVVNTFPETFRMLYRMPDWYSDFKGPLFVVEGEKDADTVAALGLHATTSGGNESWQEQFGMWLSKRSVIILPDNDAPGIRYAQSVVGSAMRAGARTIRVCWHPWPFEPDGCNDITDYLDKLDPDGEVEKRKKLLKAVIQSYKRYELSE